MILRWFFKNLEIDITTINTNVLRLGRGIGNGYVYSMWGLFGSFFMLTNFYQPCLHMLRPHSIETSDSKRNICYTNVNQYRPLHVPNFEVLGFQGWPLFLLGTNVHFQDRSKTYGYATYVSNWSWKWTILTQKGETGLETKLLKISTWEGRYYFTLHYQTPFQN